VGKNNRYDLGSLWLKLEYLNDNEKYYNEVVKHELTLISLVDADEIIQYFTGKKEFSDCIDSELK
jgi:energy-converting hydrogenase A subunit M